MSTATTGRSWRLNTATKRLVIVFVAISVLLFTLRTDTSRNLWNRGQQYREQYSAKSQEALQEAQLADQDGHPPPPPTPPTTWTATTADTPAPAATATVSRPSIDDFELPLNHSQWGQRGDRTKRLAQWAETVVGADQHEIEAFEKVLHQQFPYLKKTQKTIYTPWRHPKPDSTSTDIGMVICAGSGNYKLAAHLLASLSQVYNVTMPIEIAFSGNDDLQSVHRKFLSSIYPHLSFIDLLERFPNAKRDLQGSGWAMKPFSMLASAHSRVILVDADALFLTSPADIFTINKGLVETGTLFYHDRAAVSGGTEHRDFIQQQLAAAKIGPSHYLENESLFYRGVTGYEADSGVVALDKSRPAVILGLMFATWMNTKQVRDEVSYQIFYGDKETFWIAMELSSTPYFFQPWYAGTMGTMPETDAIEPQLSLAKTRSGTNAPVQICGTHMLHLDHAGELPFWINGGIYERKSDPSRGFALMHYYWVGEIEKLKLVQPSWFWIEGNVACLKETGVKAIPDLVQQNIERIMAVARKIDAMAP